MFWKIISQEFHHCFIISPSAAYYCSIYMSLRINKSFISLSNCFCCKRSQCSNNILWFRRRCLQNIFDIFVWKIFSACSFWRVYKIIFVLQKTIQPAFANISFWSNCPVFIIFLSEEFLRTIINHNISASGIKSKSFTIIRHNRYVRNSSDILNEWIFKPFFISKTYKRCSLSACCNIFFPEVWNNHTSCFMRNYRTFANL